MDGFDHILNWKLKEGSHPFPGKDGGTCINEAAMDEVTRMVGSKSCGLGAWGWLGFGPGLKGILIKT